MSGQLLQSLGRHIAARLGSLSSVHEGDPAGASERVVRRQVEAFRRAARHWTLASRTVDFPVVLFRALDRSRWAPYVELQDDYGWRSQLGARLQIVDVPGVHLKILEMPHVVELASRVREFLDAPAVFPSVVGNKERYDVQ